MTEPNEEINEELSTEELKSVSGGYDGEKHVIKPYKQELANIRNTLDTDVIGASLGPMVGAQLKTISPEGSGSGMTRGDWDKIMHPPL